MVVIRPYGCPSVRLAYRSYTSMMEGIMYGLRPSSLLK